MKTKLTAFLCIINASLMLHAIDLFGTYQKALLFNADYLKAVADNWAGQENPKLARANLLPQIGASLSFTEGYLGADGFYAFYHQPTYAFKLSQVLLDFSKFSAYSKSKFAAEFSDLQLTNARQQLMVNVIQAYFDVLYAGDTLLATKMTKKALQQQETQAKSAFNAGLVTIADVNDALAAYDAATAQELQDDNNLIYKKNIFRNLTGENPDLIQPLQDDTNLVLPVPGDNESWAQLAKSDNITIKMAAKQLFMAREDISIARAGHLPVLNLTAQYQYQDTGGIDGSNGSGSQLQMITSIPGSPVSSYGVGAIGLQLSIPIFSGGGISAQTRQAIANFESVNEQLIAVQRQVDSQVRNAYWNVYNGVNLVLAQKTAMKSFKTKLDSDKLGYQVGVRNSVDLVNAQKDYFKSFQQYQQSRYNYLVFETNLEYLSGAIDEKFLQELNLNIKQ